MNASLATLSAPRLAAPRRPDHGVRRGDGLILPRAARAQEMAWDVA